jgi:hypothetical protein
LVLPFLGLALALLQPAPASHGFALIPNTATGGINLTDVLAEPDNFISWDKGTLGNPILYSFDASFLAAFSDPLLQQQVHLAMQEWTQASLDAARRGPAALYRWDRLSPGPPNFWDLRSIITHEVGHMLGSQHTDAAWFNGPPYERNYAPNGGGGYIATAPIGGEIMNEGNGPGLPGSKPNKGLRRGEYWRHLSKDELTFIDYAYGGSIYFQFVANPASADMIFMNFASDNCGGTLGSAGADSVTDRDGGDPTLGGIIESASALIHEICVDAGNVEIGFDPRPDYWEVTNESGQNAISLLVTTDGTDNGSPTDQFSLGANRFTSYTNFPGEDPTESLEQILHQWSNAFGGNVPSGATVDVMLQQDVWDWQVTDAQLLFEDLTSCEVPLVEVAPFQKPQIQAPPPPDPDDEIEGLVALPAETSALKTIRILNWGTERATVDEILFVDLDDQPFPPAPSELPLVRDDAIATGGALVAVGTGPGARGPITLSPGDDFHIVLDGTTQDLLDALPDVVAAGNFHMFPSPDLPTGSYIAAVQTDNTCANVGGISHLNPPVFVPEPNALIGLSAGVLLLGALGTRSRRRVQVDLF